ncbi:MAG: hypothetical protein WC752_03810 [Patescibacteria group bacterium]|jgi:hypothetical protein
MSREKSNIKNNGFAVIELLIVASVFALLVTALVGIFMLTQKAFVSSGNEDRALMVAEEGLEAARNIRDSDYTLLTDTPHGLSTAGNQWSFSGTSDNTDIFQRVVTVSSAGTDRKQVTSAVSWTEKGVAQSVSLTSYLTNWRAAKSKKGVTPSLWCSFDLTVANSTNNVADAISIAVAGNYVYLGRATNPGSEFFVFDISNPALPVLKGNLALAGAPNDIAVSGNYAYIASNDNSGELAVINISNPLAPTLAATFNLTNANSGNNNNDGLAVVMGKTNYLYLTRVTSTGKEFYVFNITTPTAPTLTGQVDLLGDLKELSASGDYAYAASTENTQEFQVINVTTLASPALAASLDLNEGATAPDGLSVTLSTNTAYVGRDGSAAAPEFYVINTTTPTVPSITSTVDIGTHVLKSLDYSALWQLVFLANVNPVNPDYYSIDTSVPATPVLLTSLNLDGVPGKLVYDTTSDIVYMASGSDTQELQCIAP